MTVGAIPPGARLPVYRADRTRELTHACPPDGEGVTPCCGRTPFELPTHRVTLYDGLVTCNRVRTLDNILLEAYTRGAVDAAKRSKSAFPDPDEVREGWESWRRSQLP